MDGYLLMLNYYNTENQLTYLLLPVYPLQTDNNPIFHFL